MADGSGWVRARVGQAVFLSYVPNAAEVACVELADKTHHCCYIISLPPEVSGYAARAGPDQFTPVVRQYHDGEMVFCLLQSARINQEGFVMWELNGQRCC